jgi:hypothetical protein
MLSPSLLELLRAWWRVVRPRGWLFPGRNPVRPITTRQLNRACHAAAQAAGIGKNVSLHTLRPSFATHLFQRCHKGCCSVPGALAAALRRPRVGCPQPNPHPIRRTTPAPQRAGVRFGTRTALERQGAVMIIRAVFSLVTRASVGTSNRADLYSCSRHTLSRRTWHQVTHPSLSTR